MLQPFIWLFLQCDDEEKAKKGRREAGQSGESNGCRGDMIKDSWRSRTRVIWGLCSLSISPAAAYPALNAEAGCVCVCLYVCVCVCKNIDR